MSQYIINVGAAPDDGTGDPLRTAFTKINANFTELYGQCVTVNSSTYTSSNTDSYIGVNYAGPVTLTLHVGYPSARLIVKDESGACSSNAITLVGNIDNASNAVLAINNGALSLIYNNGWRII